MAAAGFLRPVEPSASGWLKYWDSEGRTFYWYHLTSGASTYARPADYATPRPDQTGQRPAERLPASTWAKYWDDNTQSYYFYDTATGVSQWERPIDFVTPRDAGAYGGGYGGGYGGEYAAGPTDPTQLYYYAAASTPAYGAAADAASDLALWVKGWSEEYQREYFFHTASGETRWDRPTGWATPRDPHAAAVAEAWTARRG